MTDPSRPAFPLGLVRQLLRRLRLPWKGRGSVAPAEPSGEQETRDLALATLRVQVDIIRRAFDDGVVAGPREGIDPPRDAAETYYLYRPGHALVGEKDLERVARYLDEGGERFRGSLDRVAEPSPGLVLVSLPGRTDGADEVLATLDELDRELGPGVVTPDHVVYVTPTGRMCPATEPEQPRHSTPRPEQARDDSAGKGVRVSVVDTGLWTDAVTSPVTPWMSGVLADPTDVETINPADIHTYGGHGTFVAGVVRCFAPASRVEVEGVLVNGGAVYESEIVKQLDEALREEDHPQLISISAGTHTRGDFALLAFEMLAAAHGLDDGEETIIVAAAGNDGSSDPFWPAAFPWVTAVGSVDPDGTVSDFSNVGESWVDVYALGRDLVNAFPKGTYTCHEPANAGQVRHFDGLAQWSGTSFATPVVTGLVAARMSATGETARQARDAVLAAGTSAVDPRGGHITIVGPLS